VPRQRVLQHVPEPCRYARRCAAASVVAGPISQEQCPQACTIDSKSLHCILPSMLCRCMTPSQMRTQYGDICKSLAPSQQHEAGAADQGSAPVAGHATAAEDQLDELMSRYAAEAEVDAKATAVKHATSKQPPQKGMQQLRTEGLATALPQDNRYIQPMVGSSMSM
jgi:hypothetical protein